MPAMEPCPLCGDDEDVVAVDLGGGLLEYPCQRTRHDGGAFVWTRVSAQLGAPDRDAREGTGLAAELGMYDDLPQCLIAGEPWVEYGIVERRYREAWPDAFAKVVERYGHSDRQHKRRYTASAYTAMILGALRDRGRVVSMGRPGPATGFWSYNSTVHYWALPPGPPTNTMLTYEQWTRAHGRDPAQP